MLDKQGYMHTPTRLIVRACSRGHTQITHTYCFPTATMFSQNARQCYVHCLSCLFLPVCAAQWCTVFECVSNQCWVTFDSSLRCTRSNVELKPACFLCLFWFLISFCLLMALVVAELLRLEISSKVTSYCWTLLKFTTIFWTVKVWMLVFHVQSLWKGKWPYAGYRTR